MNPTPPSIPPSGMPGQPQRSPIKEAILRRVKVLYVLFLLLGLAVIGRVVWLQAGTEGETLSDLSDK